MVQKRLKSPERRQQILTVAMEVFAHKGYGSTTTAAIASAAGISEPILYRHFKNKKDLFHRLIENVTEQTLKQWKESLGHADSIVSHMKIMAKNLAQQLDEDELKISLINRAIADSRDDEELRQLMLAHYDSYVKFLEKLIRKGIKNKEFKKNLNVQQAAWQLMGPGLAYSATQGLNINQKLKAAALYSSFETLLNSWT